MIKVLAFLIMLVHVYIIMRLQILKTRKENFKIEYLGLMLIFRILFTLEGLLQEMMKLKILDKSQGLQTFYFKISCRTHRKIESDVQPRPGLVTSMSRSCSSVSRSSCHCSVVVYV